MWSGQRIADRFDVGSPAGSGGMAVVYRAYDRRRERTVAFKVSQPSGKARFSREAELLARLDHDGIAAYVAHGPLPGGAAFLAMEWVEGDTLADLLRQRLLSEAEAVCLGVRLADALAAAHALGVVHRDVKPGNVMVPGDDLARAKLVDFGIARVVGGEGLTRTGVSMGTLRYVAPEQLADAKRVDARADVYGLGATLTAALTGTFVPAALAETRVDPPPRRALSPELDRLLSSLCARDPAARPHDGRACRRLFEALPSTTATGAAIGGGERRLRWSLWAEATGEPPAALRRWTVAGGRHLDRVGPGSLVVRFGDTALRHHPATALEAAARWPHAIWTLDVIRDETDVSDEPPRPAGAPAEPGQVRVTEAAAALLAPHHQVVDGVLAATGHAVQGGLPLVGRRRELAALRAILDDCLEDETARLVALTGVTGIGKSRIVRHFLAEARAEGVRIVEAQGDVISDGAPLATLSSLLRALLGLARDASPTVVESALVDVVPSTAVRVFAPLLGAASTDEVDLDAARREPRVQQAALRSAVEDLFEALTDEGGSLLVIEDTHWADRPSLDLLRAALRHVRDRPLMMLWSGRPAMNERAPLEGAVDRIAVGPLSKKAGRRLAQQLVDDEARRETLVALAAGHPFLLEQLAKHGDGDRLPETVLQAVEARIDHLDEDARRVLRAASVFGRRFWRGGVEALLGGGGTLDVGPRLVTLERAELVRRERTSTLEGQAEYGFHHDLVREAAYAMLPEVDRRRGHGRAGAWLEDGGVHDAEVLAHHYGEGDEPVRATPWLVLAARQALDGGAPARAMDRIERALELGADRATGACLLATARRYAGDIDGAVEAARDAYRSSPRGEVPWYRAAGELACAASAAGRADDLDALAGELLGAPATAPARAARVAALALAAWTAHQGGHAARAFTLVDHAMATVVTHGVDDPLALGHLAGVTAARAFGRGDVGTYLHETQRAMDHYARAGDRHSSCGQALNVAVGYIGVGCYDRAREVIEAVLPRTERLGFRTQRAFALCLLAHALLELGDLDGAAERADEARALADELGHARHRGLSTLVRGRAATLRGDHEGAQRELADALELFEGSPAYRVHTLGALALDALRRGDAEESLTIADRAVELARSKRGGGVSAGALAMVRAEANLTLGRRDEAAAIVRDAVQEIRRRADAFGDDALLRTRFTEGIAAHARLLALSTELGG